MNKSHDFSKAAPRWCSHWLTRSQYMPCQHNQQTQYGNGARALILMQLGAIRVTVVCGHVEDKPIAFSPL